MASSNSYNFANDHRLKDEPANYDDSGVEDLRFPTSTSSSPTRSASMSSTSSSPSIFSSLSNKSAALEPAQYAKQIAEFEKDFRRVIAEHAALLKKTSDMEESLHGVEFQAAQTTKDITRLDTSVVVLQRDNINFKHREAIIQQKLTSYEGAQNKKYRVQEEQSMAFEQQIHEELIRFEEKLVSAPDCEQKLTDLQRKHEETIRALLSKHETDVNDAKNKSIALEQHVHIELARFEEEMRSWASDLIISDICHEREEKSSAPRQQTAEVTQLKAMLEHKRSAHQRELESLHIQFQNEKRELEAVHRAHALHQAERLQSQCEHKLADLRSQNEIAMAKLHESFLQEKSELQKMHEEAIQALQNELSLLKKQTSDAEENNPQVLKDPRKKSSKSESGQVHDALSNFRQVYEEEKAHWSEQLKAKEEEVENLKEQLVESYDHILNFQKKIKKLSLDKNLELEENGRRLKAAEEEVTEVKQEFNRLDEDYQHLKGILSEKESELVKLQCQLAQGSQV